jgi:methylamine---glutamate N-methyltransferase subunit C
MPWASLCELSDLTEGNGLRVDEAGFRLAVFLSNGKVHVLDDRCPHAHGSLGTGHVNSANCAVCPLHGWAFNLDTGQMPDLPGVAVSVYPTRLRTVSSGKTFVQVDLPLP